MKPLRSRLKEISDKKNIAQHVIEKDYALSYILAGISQHKSLASTLVFKGGTALKKIFFGNYRFSEDLDFSVINAPKNDALQQILTEVSITAEQMLQQFGAFTVLCKRNSEKMPHPHGQEAFVILVKFPWHPTPLCRIKVEITHDEPVLMTPNRLPLIHSYGEPLDCRLLCYTIEEIIAEKLRALLQTHHKLITKGWSKPRARDYYDLWRLLKDYRTQFSAQHVVTLLKQKCQHRDVFYQRLYDFFTDELCTETRKHWQNTLGNMVLNLQPCELVIEQTRSMVEKLFANANASMR